MLASNFNSSSHKQNSGSSVYKTIPKNIIHDKEQMYEEVLNLKNNTNAIKAENVKLKTKIKQDENELAKKDKIIKDILAKNPIPELKLPSSQIQTHRSTNETHLIVALKEKVKEVKQENNALNEEIQTLKQSIKYTAMHEMETEIKMYAEECNRLRNKLEEITAFQQNQIQTKEDAERRKTIANQKEEEKRNYKGIMKSQTKSTETESNQLQKIINEQKQEIITLKEQVKNSARSSERAKSKNTEADDAIKILETKQIEQIRLKDNEINLLKEKLNEGIHLNIFNF